MHAWKQTVLSSLALLAFAICQSVSAASLLLPRQALSPTDVAVVINDADPLSVRIGAYYQVRRGIPDENIIHVRFPAQGANLPEPNFQRIYREVLDATPAGIQAYALTWARPFKVDCQSITTAFATGFDRRYCAQRPPGVTGCRPTGLSPYFASDSLRPLDETGIRPTMAIAARSFADAKALIDRGIRADHTRPNGNTYLLKTNDPNRNGRWVYATVMRELLKDRQNFEYLTQDTLVDRADVLAYFTGLTRIEGIDRLNYLPGAVADHLTSAGGIMPVDANPLPQMSALRWLEAGATGSYGTVVEPCNFLQKFPNPVELLKHYLNGATLIEAYWKSVAWPGEGLFIGEPLARPFGVDSVAIEPGGSIKTRALAPGRYALESATMSIGPYRRLGDVTISYRGEPLEFGQLEAPHYRLVYLGANTIPQVLD